MRLEKSRPGFFCAVFWVVLFYIFIFQPPVAPKLTYLALQLFFVVMVTTLCFRRVSRFWRVFKTELVLVLVVVFYTLLRDLLTGEIVYSDRFLGWFFQSFVVSGVLVVVYFSQRSVSVNSDYFSAELYFSAAFAAFFTLMLFYVPSLDSFYETIQLDSYYERYSSFEKRYRAYGISENLTFTYSVVLGICAGYSLILLRRSWLYFFLVPLFVFGVSVNARVGFLGLVIFVLYVILQGGLRARFLVISALMVMATWVLLFSDDFLDENAWRLGFFLDVSDFIVNGLSGDNIFSELINDHVVIPSSALDILFGTGVSIYVGADQTSDIGYILQLNYGGFTLLILLALVVFFMSIRLFKVLGYRHWYSWLFPVSMILLNFKGFIFAMTPGGRFLVLLYIFFIFRESIFRGEFLEKYIVGRPSGLVQPLQSTDSIKVNNV